MTSEVTEAAFKSEMRVPAAPKTDPGVPVVPGVTGVPGEKAASEVKMASEVTEEVTEEGDNCWRQRMAARTLQSGNSFSLARYRSVRDHNGRYYLVVKVR